MTTGEVRGMEVKTEFDDEDEHKAILLVLKTKPLFLDGRVVFTKLLKKGSNLVREVHDKQSMKPASVVLGNCLFKFGDYLGVENTRKEIDTYTTVVGWCL